MRNVWLLFKNDVKRVGQNIITTMLIIGLVCIPSLFSWYNLLACWDVFENTDGLEVAVANTDEGYKSDLVPLRINMGDQVVSALRANDQMHWVFTDEDDAIQGAKSGQYYAAVVIPKSFSADMMSFYSPDMQHAEIIYYSNEKINPIAPKMTTIGANDVSAQVNKVFDQTLSEIALGSSSALLDYAERNDASGQLYSLAGHMAQLAQQLSYAATALDAYGRLFDSTEGLVESSANLLAKTGESARGIGASIQEAKDAAQKAVDALSSSTAELTQLVNATAAESGTTTQAVNEAFDKNQQAAEQAEASLRALAAAAQAAGDTDAAQTLITAADAVKAASDETQAARRELLERTDAAYDDLAQVKQDYDEQLRPLLQQLAASLDSTNKAIVDTTGLLEGIGSELSQSADSITARLQEGQQKIGEASGRMSASSEKLQDLQERLTEALASGNIDELKAIIGTDPQEFASHIAAPIQLEKVAVYPVDNFGSSIAPLYTSLALWIGALLIVVTLKTEPTEEELKQLRNPTLRQIFFGRFCYIGVISLLQSTFLAVGNMLFVGVQVMHPLLYLICFWLAGLVFTFTMYTLVALFANLGKSFGVILLVLQISGGGGSYPLAVLPPLIRDASPFLPATHVIDAMRAAMFGIYQNDFWIEIGQLMLFLVPLLVLVIVFIRPLKAVVPKFVARIEKSELM